MLVQVLSEFTVSPSPSGGPGANALQVVINWASYLVLGLCVLSVVLGGAATAVGHWSGNHHAARAGKLGVLGGVAGAGLVFLAAALVHFGELLGRAG
jgi:hypothetical protein